MAANLAASSPTDMQQVPMWQGQQMCGGYGAGQQMYYMASPQGQEGGGWTGPQMPAQQMVRPMGQQMPQMQPNAIPPQQQRPLPPDMGPQMHQACVLCESRSVRQQLYRENGDAVIAHVRFHSAEHTRRNIAHELGVAPESAEIDQMSANVGQPSPSLAAIGEILAKLAQHRSNLGRSCPGVGRIGANCGAKFGPPSYRSWLLVAQIRPHGVESD